MPRLHQLFQFPVFSLGVVLRLQVIVEEFGDTLPEARGDAAFVLFPDFDTLGGVVL